MIFGPDLYFNGSFISCPGSRRNLSAGESRLSSEPEVTHLHTYFLFPAAIDRAAVIEEHPEIWRGSQSWFEKLDHWVTGHVVPEHAAAATELGRWQRHSESGTDFHSPAYEDMMFFHPFIRRAFFDTGASDQNYEALVHRYVVPAKPGSRLFYEAEDSGGEFAKVEITNLELLIFANGIAILSIGVEARDIPYSRALWINEMMRKIYPSSGRQIQTGRIPNRLALVRETAGERHVIVEERWATSRGIGSRPQLSTILLSLFHFANYAHEEFDASLDERMIVNSFANLDRTRLTPGFEGSEDYEIAFSRFLYVDRAGPGYRYDPEFLRGQMKKHVYRRWQHLGTLYGMTSYSNVTCTLASPAAPDADQLVHRMFCTKNLLIAVIALFYRASLLAFAKESALVSRQLFLVFSGGRVRHRHIQLATQLMADFHYFNNYWFHLEPTTKDEELEHFTLLSDAYQLGPAKAKLEDQIDKLSGYIDRLYALRNSDAVNRLAMMSVMLGIGALITGYYGMNISHLTTLLQNGPISFWSLVLTSLMAVASLWFVVYIVASNWVDYRASILPHRYRKAATRISLRNLRRYDDADVKPAKDNPGPPEH
jgi:hypothetical protein